jgi:hypothetical protein
MKVKIFYGHASIAHSEDIDLENAINEFLKNSNIVVKEIHQSAAGYGSPDARGGGIFPQIIISIFYEDLHGDTSDPNLRAGIIATS